MARPPMNRMNPNEPMLIARESNEAAIRFYESLGFSVEGKMKSRIRNIDGTLEADIPMAWICV